MHRKIPFWKTATRYLTYNLAHLENPANPAQSLENLENPAPNPAPDLTFPPKCGIINMQEVN